MIKIIMLLLTLMPFGVSLEANVLQNFRQRKAAVELPPSIKVLIVRESPGVVVEVKGRYHLYDPRTNEYLSSRYEGKRMYIQALKDGLKWGESFPGLYQLKIVPADSSVTTIVDGIEYRGAINIYDVEGSINVVNQVDVEDYLQSLLSPQIQQKLPPEVLAALAITARTNAFYQMWSGKSPFWDVDASRAGYQGHAVTNNNNPIEKAIYATRYLIMSQSSPNANEAVPFSAAWDNAKISLGEAEKMESKGADASQILARAFPGTSIILMHYVK